MRAMRIPSLAALALAAIALAPAGCNQTARSICRQRCACLPCTPADEQGCLDQADAAEVLVAKKSCEAQLDALMTCLDENLSCQGGTGPGTDQCDKQQTKLFACAGISNPFATPCEEASIKSAMCLGSPPPPITGAACPANAACSAQCILDAECDVIIGNTFSKPFQDCFSACSFK